MDPFNQEDFIALQRTQPPRNPSPPSQGGSRPGSNSGPRPPVPGPGPNPGPRPPVPGPGPNPGPRPPVPGPGGIPENAPRTAPPNYIPSRQIAAFRVDASSIRNCLGKFTYVWLSNGEEFWMFPIQVNRNTVIGFHWHRLFGWTFMGVSLNRIDAFMCV